MTEEMKEEYGAWLKARIVSAKHDNHSFYFYFYPLFVDSAECIIFVEFLFPSSFRRRCLIRLIRCVPGMDKRLVAFPAFKRAFSLDEGKGVVKLGPLLMGPLEVTPALTSFFSTSPLISGWPKYAEMNRN